MKATVGNLMEQIVVRTSLGWILYGPRQSTMVAASYYLGGHLQITNENLQQLLKSLEAPIATRWKNR